MLYKNAEWMCLSINVHMFLTLLSLYVSVSITCHMCLCMVSIVHGLGTPHNASGALLPWQQCSAG